MFELLVRHLEQKGLVDRREFSQILRHAADEAAADLSPDLPKRRFDLAQMRNVAQRLDLDYGAGEQIPRWKPELILGGLSEPPDEPTTNL